MTGIEEWEKLKLISDAKITECHQLLDTAYENANQTFVERLSKVDSATLIDMLEKSQNEMSLNYVASQNHLNFCLGMLEKHDALLRKEVSEVKKHLGRESTSFDKALVETAKLAELESAGKIAATSTKIVLEALLLCAILAGFLGHKEAVAFQEGAKKELVGAIGDPGAGILMLLKRLYAVSTRTLRADQNANELLMSLEDFHKLMIQWRQVCAMISQDVALDQALIEVFENDIA